MSVAKEEGTHRQESSNMNKFLMQMKYYDRLLFHDCYIVTKWEAEKAATTGLRNSETLRKKKVKLLCRFIHTCSNTCSYVCHIIKIFASKNFRFSSNWANVWEEIKRALEWYTNSTQKIKSSRHLKMDIILSLQGRVSKHFFFR